MKTNPENVRMPKSENGQMPRQDMIEHIDTIQAAEQKLPTREIHPVAHQNVRRCHIYDLETYKHMYNRSLNDVEAFWTEQAMSHLRWLHPFSRVTDGKKFQDGATHWFSGGRLNVCDNCVDRWVEVYPNKPAVIWEGDEPGTSKIITYNELLINVCKVANMLLSLGVRKYDTVAIYMPMRPEVVYCMLACTRIGAVHSVVFAGFSHMNLSQRINDANCKIILTANMGIRGGKEIHLKSIVDEALKSTPTCTKCVVFKTHDSPLVLIPGRDVDGTELMAGQRPYCPLEPMDSEDLLFLLYTSGSTGKPKGIAHSTGGYLLFSAMTFRYVFDYHPGEIFACVADVGWITGHSYVVYGPLCSGATTILFESIPTYPNAGRYWSLIEKYKINQFYTAPTAIRALMKLGDEWPRKYDLSSLRVLGTVGEPINPEAWRWYNVIVGQNRCNIVDTYWQTETGGHVLTPLPGAIETKPGSATLPFFGIEPAILDSHTGKEISSTEASGVLCFKRPWPGMMRTIYGNHTFMVTNYLKPFAGYYFTGDGCVRDKDGYYWITGRIDDTINVSGHRIGTAEIEHALVQCAVTAESAVVGVPHEIKGSGIFCYVILKDNASPNEDTRLMLRKSVREFIGPVATPDEIVFVPGLPKTRSGKILRRLLRKIAANEAAFEQLGDVSTLANPHIINDLIRIVAKDRQGK